MRLDHSVADLCVGVCRSGGTSGVLISDRLFEVAAIEPGKHTSDSEVQKSRPEIEPDWSSLVPLFRSSAPLVQTEK